jgi:dihydroflavonol-4-reductase
MADKQTLVTGATGFVGSAVARVLAARGHRVRVTHRKGSDLSNLEGLDAEAAEADLRDPASLARAVQGCGAVFHVAADYRIWVPDPASMLAANVEGTVALMRAASDAGVERIVYCSSVAALGLTKDGTPADEASPVSEEQVVGVYKKSKYRAEQAVLAMAREGLPVVVVNPSTPIGPRDVKPTPTGRMIRDAARGRMPAYVETGLNIVHVDDVAEGHALAVERGRVGEKYILGGENMSLGALLGMVAEATGRKPPRIKLTQAALWPLALASEAAARAFGIEPVVTRDHLRMSRKMMFFSSAKAQAELGYRPRPAREAVADAVAWFAAR